MCDIIKEWYEKKITLMKWGNGMGWEAFALSDMGFSVILCEKGVIYTPEDGTILHCLCKNKTE